MIQTAFLRYSFVWIAMFVSLSMNAQTTIWSENWDNAGKSSYPEAVDSRYYANKVYTVVKTNGTAYAGGKLPELLLYKGDTFTVDLTLSENYGGNLVLQYNSNRTDEGSPRMEVTANGKPVEITSEGKKHTGYIDVSEDMDHLMLAFTAINSNARLDNISLTGSASTKQKSVVSFGEGVDNQTFVVYKNQTGDFSSKTATLTGPSATDAVLVYESSNNEVASVDEQGKVTFLALGKANITARYAGNEDYAAAKASYTIDYTEDNSIVFSQEYQSFKNVETSYAKTSRVFIGKNKEQWTFSIASGNNGMKRVGSYLQLAQSVKLKSPYMDEYTNGYDVIVDFFQAGNHDLYLSYSLDGNPEVTATGTTNGTTYDKKDGYTVKISVPMATKFNVCSNNNVAIIKSITIIPKNKIEKQKTILSFPASSYTIVDGMQEEFDSPKAKLTTAEGDIIDNATIAYSISENDNLAINEETGEITGDFLVGQTITVTAAFAGNEQYEAAHASYTLKVVSDEQAVITLSEEQDIDEDVSANNGNEMRVILKRKLSGKYNTICLPFDLTAQQVADAFGEDCVVSEYSYVEDGVMYFTSVDAMEAGIPYLLSVSNALEEITIPNVLIDNSSPVEVSRTHDNPDFMFCGTYSPFAFSTTDGTQLFLTTNGVLKKPSTAGSKMKGMRAYFLIPQSADVNTLSVSVDKELTGISEVHADGTKGAQGVYNLNGQKVGDDVQGLHRGIYIVNGKKRVIK